MSKDQAQRINYNGVVILVEGKDDCSFIEKLATNDKPNIIDMKYERN